jgi:predicted O-methyltransferase YrrM
MTALSRYSDWLTVWSDVQTHLPRLFSASHGAVLELGVRAGVTTAALLAGVEVVGGVVWSVDHDDCSPVFTGHPQWRFVQADSLDERALDAAGLPQTLDLLFIDTVHTADRTTQELQLWGGRVAPGGVIYLHDTDDPSTMPGVRDAMEAYCRERGITPIYHAGSYGLGEIRPA